MRLRRGFLAPDAADALAAHLLATLEFSSPEVRVFGRRHPVPRRLAFAAASGLRYAYSGIEHIGGGLDAPLAGLFDAVAQATGHRFDSVLVHDYRSGADRLGWHADDEAALGVDPAVAIVSLGAARTLRFRRRDPEARRSPEGRGAVTLAHGDLLLMEPGFQRAWQHALPPRARAGRRLALGLRRLGA